MGKLIVAILVITIVLGAGFWRFGPDFFNRAESGPTTLTIWDVRDDDSVFRSVIGNYEKTHPNITINFNHQSAANYRKRVQTKIGEYQGPDILAIHNTWLGMFLQGGFLASAPDSIMSFDDFNNTFYPVAVDSFTQDKKVYALPAGVDGLALFYNDDLLKAAGVSIPVYWSDLIASATKMTVADTSGNIQTAGVALGSTTNVDYWSDILGLLFLQQPGVNIASPDNQLGADILTFYTSFITDPKRKTWDVTMESSTQAFIDGKLAFLFAPAGAVNQIKVANPRLNFKVAPVPQLPNPTPVAWASFWGYAVSATSPHPSQAWDFLKYLTSAEVEKSLYQQALSSGAIGKPYARRDLQADLISDPNTNSLAGTFVAQGPYYKSWYLASNTGDAGINDQMIDNFKQAVDEVIQKNTPPLSALNELKSKIQPTIDTYTKIIQPAASK